jgi:oligoribonuclease
LCGNSIGTDRRFLAKYLPDIENYLHYRSVDVSSIKELAKRWYPKIGLDRTSKNGIHRALDDVKESLRELSFYRDHLFVPPSASIDATAGSQTTVTNDPNPHE